MSSKLSTRLREIAHLIGAGLATQAEASELLGFAYEHELPCEVKPGDLLIIMHLGDMEARQIIPAATIEAASHHKADFIAGGLRALVATVLEGQEKARG